MIRKSLLALAAIATLGTAALAPTSASAWGYKGWGWHKPWGYGYGFYGVRYIGPHCYWVKRINRFGVVRVYRVCG